MPQDDQAIEATMQSLGLTAPRLTPEAIDATIAGEHYYVVPGTTLTVCALTLVNGFVVIGESAAASPENFNEDLGRQIAFGKAREKIWQLEGYLLRSKLHAAAAVNPAAQELDVKVEGDRLVISIGVGILAFAVQAGDPWPEAYNVSNIDLFAKHVADEVMREEEDGTTPIHKMLDAAALEAMEQGSDAVEEDGVEAGLRLANARIGRAQDAALDLKGAD